MDIEINSPRASTIDEPIMSGLRENSVSGIEEQLDDPITYRLPATDFNRTTEMLANPNLYTPRTQVQEKPKGGKGTLPPMDFQSTTEKPINPFILGNPIPYKLPIRSSGGWRGVSVKADKLGHFTTGAEWGSKALVHAGGRHASRFSHYFSSFKSSYCHEEGIEFQQKTDLHLSALMEFISSTAREASILKECWGKLSSQRLSFCQERQGFFREFEELIEHLTIFEYENSQYREELIEKKTRIETLELEFSAVHAELASYKKRVSEREQEISILRRELRSSEEKYEHRSTEYQNIKTELETVQQTAKSFMSQTTTVDETEEVKSELTNVTRERSELRSELRELTIKHESARRDVVSLRDRLREVEIERNEMSSELIRVREEFRSFSSQESESKEVVRKSRKKEEETRQHVSSLEETVSKVRTSLSASQTEVYSLTQRLKHVEHERETVVHNSSLQATEITELQATISRVHNEIRTLTASRSELRRELERYRFELEQYQYHHQHGTECYDVAHRGLETEIQRLLESVREARTEKDRAIDARIIADRDRDQANARYEKKCREWEISEERTFRAGPRYSLPNHNGALTALTRRVASTVEPSRDVSFNETELKHVIDDEIEEGEGEEYVAPTAEEAV